MWRLLSLLGDLQEMEVILEQQIEAAKAELAAVLSERKSIAAELKAVKQESKLLSQQFERDSGAMTAGIQAVERTVLPELFAKISAAEAAARRGRWLFQNPLISLRCIGVPLSDCVNTQRPKRHVKRPLGKFGPRLVKE